MEKDFGVGAVMILTCLLYFAVGLFRDALSVLYYRAISDMRAERASGLGGAITVYDIAVIGLLVRAWSLPYIVSYAVGNAIGTYAVMKWKAR